MNQVIKESVLELLRVILLSVIPVAISMIESGETDWRLMATVAAIAALRFSDKLLHEWGKYTSNDQLVKGITRF